MNLATWHLHAGYAIAVVMFAAAACAVLIIMLKPVLERYALARPNARSSHHTPTPQGGGIAVIAATIVVASAAIIASQPPGYGLQQFGLVFGATAFLALIGAIDDIRTIAVIPRIVLQAIAVALVVTALPPELRLLNILPWWIERILLLFGGIWFVNLFNFMDGIDWMTVTEVVPVTGGIILLGLLGTLPPHAIIVALALFGALIGFAPFNRPVARLFLGDVGSLPIGLLLCWLLLLLAGGGQLSAAALLPMYYVADATVTLLRRILRHERFWEAHRSHFYHRAIDSGLTPMDVVSRVLIINLGLVALSVVTVLIPGLASEATALAFGAMIVGWLLFVFSRPVSGIRHPDRDDAKHDG